MVLDGGERVDDVGAEARVNVLRGELANAVAPENEALTHQSESDQWKFISARDHFSTAASSHCNNQLPQICHYSTIEHELHMTMII